MKKHQFRNIMILITFTVGLIFFFIHLSDIWGILRTIFAVLAPIMYGLVFAYVLNYPYRFFRDRAFKKMGTKHKWVGKLRTPLALIISYFIVFGVIGFLISILIPELSNSAKTLIDNIPVYEKTIKGAADSVVEFIKNTFGYNLYDQATFTDIVNYITGDSLSDFLSNLLNNTWQSAVGIGYTLYNWIMGIVISIYLLASRDVLLRQSRKLIIAYTPEKFNRFLFKVGDVVNNKCGKFIIGKLIDSSIIGVMCFIGMSIFRFHYPLLISFLVAVCNLIPFFGPVIGAVPSLLLLLIINPWEALGFLVFIVILQQIDGNILGPKILGESVGISGFWIMVSVIVGGGLFGLPGMLLGVPVFAAIYTLVSDGVNNRIKKKEEKKAKAAAEAAAAVAAEGALPEVTSPPAEPPQDIQ